MPDALTFVILALAAYRLQRIVTKDDWPPSEWFRNKVGTRFGYHSSWFTFVTCPWCFGFWVSAVVALEYQFLRVVPLWVYVLFAGAAVTGLIGEWESR